MSQLFMAIEYWFTVSPSSWGEEGGEWGEI